MSTLIRSISHSILSHAARRHHVEDSHHDHEFSKMDPDYEKNLRKQKVETVRLLAQAAEEDSKQHHWIIQLVTSENILVIDRETGRRDSHRVLIYVDTEPSPTEDLVHTAELPVGPNHTLGGMVKFLFNDGIHVPKHLGGPHYRVKKQQSWEWAETVMCIWKHNDCFPDYREFYLVTACLDYVWPFDGKKHKWARK